MATEPTSASDSLMLQVNRDNVLQVRNALDQQADMMQRELQRATFTLNVGLCGGDPISRDAAEAFNDKIKQMLSAHWEHYAELTAAIDRLTRAALDYGYTEQQVTESMTRMRAKL